MRVWGSLAKRTTAFSSLSTQGSDGPSVTFRGHQVSLVEPALRCTSGSFSELAGVAGESGVGDAGLCEDGGRDWGALA